MFTSLGLLFMFFSLKQNFKFNFEFTSKKENSIFFICWTPIYIAGHLKIIEFVSLPIRLEATDFSKRTSIMFFGIN